MNNSGNGSLFGKVDFFKWIDFILPINQSTSVARLFFLCSFWIFNIVIFWTKLSAEAFCGWFSLVLPIYIHGLPFGSLVCIHFLILFFINNLIKNCFLKFYKYIHLFFNLIFMKKLFLNLITNRLGHFLTAPVFCFYFSFRNSPYIILLTINTVRFHSLHLLGSNLF